ncbi:LamG domain-containing protein [Priestia sp. SB1]|uniref:LamG domain-containing protein n=1 Tax=Priestia sp. SB1 TaxID=3132359 RepID=UPI00316EAC81
MQLYGNADGTFQKTSDSTKLSTGQWYHIAVEYDYQKGGQLYIDGDAVGTRVGSGLLTTNDDDLFLYSPEASMDNVRIYNRSLSQSEISNNMNGQVTNDGLVGEWLFDDPSTSSTFADTSGNNNNAIKHLMTGSSLNLTDFLKITNLNAQDPNALKNIERAISLNSNEQAKVQIDMDVLNTESSYWNKNLKNYQTAYSRIMTNDEAQTSSLLAQEQLKQQHYSEVLQRQKTQSQTLYSILFG